MEIDNTTQLANPTDDFVLAEAQQRIQNDYREMPGLQLTLAQAARFWSLDATLCDAVLARLVEVRFLVRTNSARFARAADNHAGA